MVLRGHIKNGTIVLDEPQALPEGAEVEVSFLPPQAPPAEASEEREIPTLYERLKPFIGKAEGLPPDLSVNLDHYLYGPSH